MASARAIRWWCLPAVAFALVRAAQVRLKLDCESVDGGQIALGRFSEMTGPVELSRLDPGALDVWLPGR